MAVLSACHRCRRHKRSVIQCPRVQRSQRPRALVPVSHSSLNPLPLDTTCSQVVCPDIGTPCALPWAPRDLVLWCMIFSKVMPAGVTFVPGPPPREVTFSRPDVLWCQGALYGAAGWARRNVPVFAGGSRQARGSRVLGCIPWPTSCLACGKGRSSGGIGQCGGPPLAP